MDRRRPSAVPPFYADDLQVDDGNGLEWPFGRLEGLTHDDLRAAAYEIYFTACRPSASAGPRPVPPLYSDSHEDNPGRAGGGSIRVGGANMIVTSRIKRALGLRTRQAVPMRVMAHLPSLGMPPAGDSNGGGGETGILGSSAGKTKQRLMTSAEIMRQQMDVTDHTDNCLRKALSRTNVGQTGKKAETNSGKKPEAIVLPLELLRHLKSPDFSDPHEYHQWHRRQLKILEAGLVLHPSLPLDRTNPAAVRLAEVVRASGLKPIDTSKNSEAMRTLCSSVMALACRTQNGAPMEVCHWADGYPLNVYLYLSLLHAVFDVRDETVVFDEVDELLELMKKTWSIFGINWMIHNVCFTWALFEQYVKTGQVEPDLITATLSMLGEVGVDAKRREREPVYVRVLSAALSKMQAWAEKRLLEYHDWFDKGMLGMIENVLCLALSTGKILSEDVSSSGCAGVFADRDANYPNKFVPTNRIEVYIRSSMKSAFTKALQNGNGKIDSMMVEVEEDPCDALVNLAKETEELALFEKDNYSAILKRWHPVPAAVAVASLHSCYGVMLKQHLSRTQGLTNELVRVMNAAGKLEKMLLQMAVEESVDAADGGKSILKEMVPYDVDIIVFNLTKTWIEERLKTARDCVSRAKDTESWNPKSKQEPYAQSAMDLVMLAKATVDEFFEVQVGGRDELVQNLAQGLDSILKDYISFAASCGSKQSYIPALPQLTRCNQDSKVFQLWKKASTQCKAGVEPSINACKPGMRQGIHPVKQLGGAGDISHPRPTASCSTQRLCVRLNTLHYIIVSIHSMDKSLCFLSRPTPSPSPRAGTVHPRRRAMSASHFELARASAHGALQHVAEVAAYRLIFFDSAQSFSDSLYVGGVSETRILPTLRVLKQNLSLLVTVLSDRAQPLTLREIMKASLVAFAMVLLAGGPARAFLRTDYEMVVEDLASLKQIFCTCREDLVAEELVQKEAATLEGVVALMEMPSEKLVEKFTVMVCQDSGGLERLVGMPMPMPPTTGRWHRSDPNTVLRVLCHRNDDVANRFLKRAYDLPKRK